LRRFEPENTPKAYGGRATPGPAEGAYSALPDQDLLAGFKECGKGMGNGKRQEGMGQLRKGTEEGEKGREVRRDGRGGKMEGGEKGKGKILPPRLFLKVSAYGRDWLVVQGLTSHRTHYRSYQRRVFCKGFPSLLRVKRPNQQH